MKRNDIIRIAREAGFRIDHEGEVLEGDEWHIQTDVVERFADLVAAAEREKVARWQIGSGYATGHGDTIEDLLVELEWQVRESEREECAKVCDKEAEEWYEMRGWLDDHAKHIAAAIRARGQG